MSKWRFCRYAVIHSRKKQNALRNQREKQHPSERYQDSPKEQAKMHHDRDAGEKVLSRSGHVPLLEKEADLLWKSSVPIRTTESLTDLEAPKYICMTQASPKLQTTDNQ